MSKKSKIYQLKVTDKINSLVISENLSQYFSRGEDLYLAKYLVQLNFIFSFI